MFFKNLNINGTEYPLAVNITGAGAPTTATEGSVGMLYMDTDTGVMYKCVAEGNVWELLYVPPKVILENVIESGDILQNTLSCEDVMMYAHNSTITLVVQFGASVTSVFNLTGIEGDGAKMYFSRVYISAYEQGVMQFEHISIKVSENGVLEVIDFLKYGIEL